MTLDSVPELIATINRLPSTARVRARERVEQAIARPAVEARAALGLLALELAADERARDESLRLDDSVQVVDGARQPATV